MAEEKKTPQVAEQVPFLDLCMVLQRINDITVKEKKKDVFRLFLNHWRQTHAKMHGESVTKDDTFFAAMRMFLPSLDKERPSYGMKEVVLAKYYIDALNIARDSADAKKLLNYRVPNAAKQEIMKDQEKLFLGPPHFVGASDAGDFAAVVYLILKDRCPEKGSLTISDVNTSLDAMAQASVEKNRDMVKSEIQKLIRNMTALEQKWLVRIILKELKIGLNENSIFAIFHPDALELYNVCSSLSKVCLDLHDPKTSLSETEITLFSPFRPMLGQRAAFNEVEKLMNHERFFIETKVDGERIQLHKKKEEYRYFSRGCHDYSDSFGRTRFKGTLTPHIADLFTRDIDSCILDGEMIAYDPQTNSFVSKGSNVDIKADTLDGIHPCFVIFDILLLNGEKLANHPLSERIKRMERIVKPIPGRFQFVTRTQAATREEVISALNDAIDKREEGIVVKHPGSVYKPSKRKGSGWLKIKPEYVDSLCDELDVLIVGGYFGVGRRGGMISHFLCAVAVPPQNKKERPTVFHSFCKVGSGYTLKQLRDLCQNLNPHWKKFDTKNPPSHLVLASGYKEKPDVWIEPSKSKIVQIKAAEITASEKFKCGYTLRFPRVEKIRDDKHWFDCMDVDELEHLKAISGGHLANRNFIDAESSEPSRKKRKTVTRNEKPRYVAAHFKGADVTSVKEVSKLFENLEFCVINGSAEFPKDCLEKKIAEHSGKFVQTPGVDTFCVIAGKTNFRVKNIIRQGEWDVVQVSWLLKCLEEHDVFTYRPQDMIFTSQRTNSRFQENYDKYGDSYFEDLDTNRLCKIFENMNGENIAKVEDDQIAEIEFRYFPNDSKLGLFRRCKAYIDEWSRIGDPSSEKATNNLDQVSLEFQFYGGQLSIDLQETTTHVIVNKNDTSRLSEIRGTIRKMDRKPHIVSEDWLLSCINQCCRVDERSFEPA